MRWKQCMCCWPSRTAVVGPAKSNLDTITLLMLGLDNAGKTTVAKAVCGAKAKQLSTIAPTIGFDRNETVYKGHKIEVFDLGGCASFRDVWPAYFSSTHGFVFVMDSTMEKTRLIECKDVLEKTLRHTHVMGKPVWVVCNNKSEDTNPAIDTSELLHALDLERIVNQAQCITRVDAAVALKNQNLRSGFKWLVRTVLANMSELGPRVLEEVMKEAELERVERDRVLQRIRERDDEDDHHDTKSSAKTFVPLQEMRSKWEAEEKAVVNHVGDQPQIIAEDEEKEEKRRDEEVVHEHDDQRKVLEEPRPMVVMKSFENNFDAIQEESLSIELTPLPHNKHIELDVEVIRADTTSSLSRLQQSIQGSPSHSHKEEDIEIHDDHQDTEKFKHGQDTVSGPEDQEECDQRALGPSNNDLIRVDHHEKTDDNSGMTNEDEVTSGNKTAESNRESPTMEAEVKEWTSFKPMIMNGQPESKKRNSSLVMSSKLMSSNEMEDMDAILPASDENDVVLNPHFNSSTNTSPIMLPPITNNQWLSEETKKKKRKKNYFTKMSNKVGAVINKENNKEEYSDKPLGYTITPDQREIKSENRDDSRQGFVKENKKVSITEMKRNKVNKGNNGFLNDQRVVKIYSQSN